MKLEMPYLMNVILYIQNDVSYNIPFISKTCLNACYAMKVNPWLNPSNKPFNDYKKVIKIFPNIHTLRIDIHTLNEIQQGIINSEILMIDIIHSNYDIDTNNINELLLDKFITSFDGIIRENTKKLYYNNQQDNLNQINNNSSISFIYVNTNYNNDTKFIDDLIVDLNSIKKSIKIRLDLFNCDYSNIVRYFDNKNSNITLVLKKHKNSFVVFDDNNIESLISPFKNKDMMYLYEKYYLPTTLTIPMLQKGMNDFTIFKYVNKVRIEKYHPNVKTFIKLPRTIQKFDSFICYETAINDIQITNWNDLILLKKINHYSNLDIPYPQIKYVSIKNNYHHLIGQIL